MGKGRLRLFGFWLLCLFQAMAMVRATPPDLGILERLEAGVNDFNPYQLVPAFEGIVFEEPVAMAPTTGGAHLFVAERSGKIWCLAMDKPQSKLLSLDLTHRTESTFVEAGLLGIACHPGFEANHQIFTFRTLHAEGFKIRISKFTGIRTESGVVFDPSTEEIVFEQIDQQDTHNGGHLEFGPDGYLYFGVGDEGPPPAQQNGLPQTIEGGLFAGLFRIDVHGREGNLAPNPAPRTVKNYLVPVDNPFVGASSFMGRAVDPSQVVTEYFAVGFRNPWRFAFHGRSGRLVLGDVGAGAIEEINIVEAGKNYGWPFREGVLPGKHFAQEPLGFEWVRASIEYRHGYATNEGNAVIAGVFYEGSELRLSSDDFVFADYSSGNIWMSTLGTEGFANPKWLTSLPGISTISTHPVSKEPLFADLHTGRLWRLASTGSIHPPQWLSQTGLFEDTPSLTPNRDLVPYWINQAFWSDHALKRRWVSVRAAGAPVRLEGPIGTISEVGTLWVKHFDMERVKGDSSSSKPLETRLLWRTASGVAGLSYLWKEDGTDAELVPPEGGTVNIAIQDSGSTRLQSWSLPTRSQCVSCHTDQGGGALGFNLAQLGGDAGSSHLNGLDQLARLRALGVIDHEVGDLPADHKLASLEDDSAPMRQRLRSFLQVNCAQCHQPGTWVRSMWDGRITTPFHAAGILNGKLVGPRTPTDRVLSPGSPEDSMMLHRVSQRQDFFMPPFGSTEPPSHFVGFLSNYLSRAQSSGLLETAIGGNQAGGSVEFNEDGSLVFYGSGTGFAAESDSFYFFSWSMPEYSTIAGEIPLKVPVGATGFNGGLMVRLGLGAADPFVFIGMDSFGKLAVANRTRAGTSTEIERIEVEGNLVKVQLRRKASTVEVMATTGGGEVVAMRELPMLGEGAWSGGVATSSGSIADYAKIELRNLAQGEISVSAAGGQPEVTLPETLEIKLQPNLRRGEAVRLFVKASDGQICEADADGTAFWQPESSGSFELHPAMELAGGMVVWGKPLAIEVRRPAFRAWLEAGSSNPLEFDLRSLGGFHSVVPGSEIIGGEIRSVGAVVGLDDADWGGFVFYGEPGTLAKTHWRLPSEGRIQLAPSTHAPRSLSIVVLQPSGGVAHLSVQVKDLRANVVVASQVFGIQRGFAVINVLYNGETELLLESLGGGVVIKALSVKLISAPFLGWSLPDRNLTWDAGHPLELEFSIPTGAEDVTGIDLYRNGTLLKSIEPSRRIAEIDRVRGGRNDYTLTATTRWGSVHTSEVMRVHGTLPSAEARFLSEDWSTRGDWPKRYGGEAHYLFGASGTDVDGIELDLGFSELFVFYREVWENGKSSLMIPDSDEGLAACLVATRSPTLRLAFLDGSWHLATLYFADFSHSGRSTRIKLQSTDNLNVLDTRTIGDFAPGVYLSWLVRGRLELELEPLVGNAIVSGLFIDDHKLAYELWVKSRLSNHELDQGLGLVDKDPDADGYPNWVEFVFSTNPLVEDSPYSLHIQGTGSFISFRHNPAAVEYQTMLETSFDLAHWTPVECQRLEGGILKHEFGAETSNSQFFRLKAFKQ